MVAREGLVKFVMVAMLAVVAVAGLSPMAMAQAQEHAAADPEAQAEELRVAQNSGRATGWWTLGLGLGAGLAVGLAGLGTGLAQSGVGAGGTGAMAEKPELFTSVIILFAIPETIVIMGLAIGFLLYTKI